MLIAIDFDGTCVTHDYPNIGKDIGAIPILKRIVENGHQIILYTMRSGEELEDAKRWFVDNNIKIWSINENPTQNTWTDSRKVYANLYIDDAALGVPLIFDKNISNRPFVNWKYVEQYLEKLDVI